METIKYEDAVRELESIVKKMENEQLTFEFAKRPTIKGFPELRWTGKRPYDSTQYYPAQLRERYGEETNGWINKIFWGDNLQVMSHLLKKYRGQVKLIYIVIWIKNQYVFNVPNVSITLNRLFVNHQENI